MKNRRLSASKFENPEISELNEEIKRLTNDLISAKDRNWRLKSSRETPSSTPRYSSMLNSRSSFYSSSPRAETPHKFLVLKEKNQKLWGLLKASEENRDALKNHLEIISKTQKNNDLRDLETLLDIKQKETDDLSKKLEMIKNHKKSLVYIEQLKQSLGEINHELSLENQKILQFESKTDLTKEEKSQTMTEKEREKIRWNFKFKKAQLSLSKLRNELLIQKPARSKSVLNDTIPAEFSIKDLLQKYRKDIEDKNSKLNINFSNFYL